MRNKKGEQCSPFAYSVILRCMKALAFVLCCVLAGYSQNVAPSMDALMALEKQANEAANKGDAQFFDGLLSDKFVMRRGRERMDKAAALNFLSGMKCDLKTLTLDDPSLTMIDADTYVLIYRETSAGTCTVTGGSPVDITGGTARVVTVWIRSGDKWQPAFHGQNLIVDPKERKAIDLPYIHSWTAAHFGKIMKEFAASVKRESLIPAGAPLDHVHVRKI